jgi:Tfp pilus assembly protein PilN
MIKINLSTVKKPLDVTKIGGLDLSKLNVKYLVLGIFLIYVPDLFLNSTWEEERTLAQEEINQLTTEKNQISRKVKDMKEFQEQVDALNTLELKLTEKLNVVRQILTTKKNPFNLMVYIAKNIPQDLWLTELSVIDNKLKIAGKSLDYKSIGKFQEDLKNSIFLSNDFKLDSVKNIEELGRRYEVFEFSGTVTKFE